MTTSGIGPLMRAMSLVDRVVSRLEFGALIVACAALFVTMLLVFMDAVSRYSFNSPLKFTTDLVTLYLISSALLLVLSDTLRRGSHISVDLFVQLMPKRLYHLLIGVVLICSVGVVGIMAFETSMLSLESLRNNELMVGIYPWPLWLSKAIVAFSLVLLTLRLFHVGVSQLTAGVTGNFVGVISIAQLETQPEEEGV